MFADTDRYVSKQAQSSKRGIGFNTLYEADIAAIEKGISWTYNWAAAGYNQVIGPLASQAEVLYVPMVWNGNGNWETQIRNLKKSHPECEYILAFNEPNLRDQANMTPSDAAAKWPPLKALAKELNMKIVAPAMNYGTLTGYSDPIKWLDEFFAQPGVSIDDIAALSIHCYMRVPSALKSYVERFRKYGKPVWMTEFCAWEGSVSVEQQRSYMSDVINYFEAEPLIERYAWFMYDGPKTKGTNYPNYALRESGNRDGELTDLGKIYVYMSSLDKELYYAHNQVVPSEHYSNSNMSEAVGAENANKSFSAVQLKVSSDETGILEVANFGLPKWLEYNIAPNVKGDYNLIIRYASNGDSKCKIHVNNVEVIEIDLPKTGGYTEWATITTSAIPLKAGKQIIRFTPSKGMVSMNWWRYKRQQ
jgi:hypothetical protein